MVDGHIVVRDPSRILRLFETESNIMLQSAHGGLAAREEDLCQPPQ